MLPNGRVFWCHVFLVQTCGAIYYDCKKLHPTAVVAQFYVIGLLSNKIRLGTTYLLGQNQSSVVQAGYKEINAKIEALSKHQDTISTLVADRLRLRNNGTGLHCAIGFKNE